MRALLLAVVLAYSLAVVAESNPSAPSAVPNASDKQSHTKNPDAKSADNQSETQAPPISIVVSPTIGAQAHGDGEGKSGKESSHEDRTLEIIGIVVTALATIVVAAFTWRLSSSTSDLWKEARRSGDTATTAIELAREEFIASHRPRFVLRDIALNYIGADPSDENLVDIIISYTVANTGDMAGTLFTRNAAPRIISDQSYQSPTPVASRRESEIDVLANKPENISIEPGRRRTFTEEEKMSVVDWRAMKNHPTVGHVLGFVAYRDKNDREFFTAFCRRRNHDTGRCAAIADPEYEYQD